MAYIFTLCEIKQMPICSAFIGEPANGQNITIYDASK